MRSLVKSKLFWPSWIGLAVGIFLGQTYLKTTSEDIAFKLRDPYADLGEGIIEQSSLLRHHHSDTSEDRSMAEKLYKEVKVLCWIMTGAANHKKKAYHVYKTWGRRCNKLLFMSSTIANGTHGMEIIALDVKEGRNELFHKSKEAFKYVYEKYLNEYDWFLKTDDDTYVVLENLRYMLYPYSAETPVYFGHRFNQFIKEGYMSGGAGYVLSREALKLLVEKSLNDSKLCREDGGGAEDIEIGKCLVNVGVKTGDSRDWNTLQGRFFPFAAQSHLEMETIDKEYWFFEYQYYEPILGAKCCSDRAIAFHYLSPSEMYLYDYLIYHLRPYGISEEVPTLPKKLPMDEKRWNTIDDVNKMVFE